MRDGHVNTATSLKRLLQNIARRHGLVVHGAITPGRDGEFIRVEWYAPLWMMVRAGLVDDEQARLVQAGEAVEWADETCTQWRLHPQRSPEKPVHRLVASHLPE